ncbi:MAG: hydrolase 76 protein [Chrysothrix sp. TS-e1954]|nr:MAG: hydrolase 76 protein [Chrysothrix sp. TS-e1954]
MGLSRTTRLLCAALVGAQAVHGAIDFDPTDIEGVKYAASRVAYNMMTQYKGNESGQVPGYLPTEGEPNGLYWWEGGAMFGALIDYWFFTGDDSYNDVTIQGMQFQVGDANDFSPSNQTLDLGNDDQAFWALSAMSATEQNFPNPPEKDPQWLALVQAVFNEQALRWDNATCGGGLRWQFDPINSGYTYKNSISNGCLMNMAARLGKYTGNTTYLTWAEKAFNWTKEIGLITPQWTVFDGTDLTQNCTGFNRLQWTYNAGVYLYSAAVMWNVTQSDFWYQNTANLLKGIDFFFPNGQNIMVEQACEPIHTCNTDQLSFKAYLSRWMGEVGRVAPWTWDTIQPKLQASAGGAAKSCNNAADGAVCGLSWTRGSYDGDTGIGQQMAALAVIQSNLVYTKGGPVTSKQGTSKGDAGGGSASTGAEGDAGLTSHITTADKAGADDIQSPPPSNTLHQSIPGGAGTYAALGSLLFTTTRPEQSPSGTSSPEHPDRNIHKLPLTPDSIGWIADEGHDFPDRVRDEIKAWGSAVHFRQDPSRQTTRAWCGYEDNSEKRSFKYTTPKRRLEAKDLTRRLLASRCFHLICSASRCMDVVTSIKARRTMELFGGDRARADAALPLFIWEPMPDLCVPAELETAKQASMLVDIVSPNHVELCSFYDRTCEYEDRDTGEWAVEKDAVEACAKQWVREDAKPERPRSIVVRVGKEGCFSYSEKDGIQWTTAYHQDSSKVVDPTGGGNAFLGGFAMGFLAEGTLKAGATWGSVAASFAIEQVGLPSLTRNAKGEDLWNGDSALRRLIEFQQQ